LNTITDKNNQDNFQLRLDSLTNIQKIQTYTESLSRSLLKQLTY